MRAVVMLVGLMAATAGAAEVESKAEAPEVAARETFLGLSVLPGGFTRPGLGVEVEHALGERVSVRLGVRAGASWTSSDYAGHVSHTREFSLGAEPGVRLYLTGRAPSGLWVGGNLELQRMWSTFESPLWTANGPESTLESHARMWSVGAAGLVGYSMVLREGLTVQAGVGFGAAQGWQRTQSAGVVLGVAPSGDLMQLPDPTVSPEARSTSWAFHERVAFAVGWAF